MHDFTVLARQVLVQSLSCSRARSKRVMNQTMFDVPDPLVVHLLLLTHEFMYNVICLPHSWYPQCDRCSATWSSCAQNTQMMIPPLCFNAVAWSWQMLDCFLWFYAVLQCYKQRCAFFPFPGFFTRYYKPVLQQHSLFTHFTYAAS